MPDLRNRLHDDLADRYRLERELGRGGMATVYLAQDLRHKRPVALKVLHPDLARTLGPERFQREIELAARLQHPHILTVLDSGESAGQLWFTMPYVEGESLRDRLRRQKQLPVDEALRITREAAGALDYAHRHGVIHRDVKPENILLSDGQALLADFGIARALAGSDEKLTETGMAVGTPAYMSPEQGAGERELDARTDVYALGSVLYEMLAGEPPFTGPTAQAIIAKRFKGAVPSVRDMRGAVPEGVDRAIKQALALVPADRFGSTAEFARALAAGMGPVSMAFVTQATPPDATTVSTSAPSGARPNRAMAIAFVLGLAVMASTGMLVWQRNHRATEPSTDGIQRLAVLPFQNLGSPDDAYFADGITDEVRGKLAAIPGLQVTASSSSSQYKGSTASPQQIGQELGVQYLLVGKVRWEKGAAGQNRVRVSPELVQVATASTKWQQPFDAALTDVFQVQADIAGRVADALDLALGSPQRQALGARPTANLEAYDAFLKGEAASDRIGTIDPARLKAAIGYYERAISLDSTFALAWAQLSRTYTAQYQAISATAAAAEGAKRGAERAAALAPGSAETQLALGDYYVTILVDPNRALTAYETGVRAFPNNAELLAGAATAQTVLGHWDQAVPRLQRAVLLDPRTAWIGGSLANALLLLRRYAEAEEVCRRGLAANPGNLGLVEADLTISLMHGDTTEARARLQKGASGVDPEVVAAYFATYGDLYWVLDSAQQEALLGLGPSRYGDRGNWALVMAEVYGLRGEQTKSRTYADSARIAYEDQLRERPRDPLRHTLLGLSLAYLGRKAEAIREGQRGIELYPFEQSVGQSYVRHQLVRIYLLTNEFDEGLERLEPLLKMPYILTPGWLKIDPNFAPLRGNPRFERLANGTQA